MEQAAPHAGDLFEAVLTMLDPDVTLDLATVIGPTRSPSAMQAVATSLTQDIERAENVGRNVGVHELAGEPGPELVRLAIEKDYDVIVLDGSAVADQGDAIPSWHDYVHSHAPCALCVMSLPAIPREVVDSTPSTVVPAIERPKPR
jgi:nucleotide-binding universal stress UspA family protein